MDIRYRATGPETLEPSIYSAPSDGLSREIADALELNLSRGFLESEERFLQIADALQDVVVLSSSDLTQLFFVNAAYERIWGRSRAELYANPRSFLDGVHSQDRERVWDALRNQPAEGADIEFRVVRPDAVVRWVWVSTFPVSGALGEIHRFAGIAEDITERKQVLESHARLIRGFTHDVKNPLGAADGLLTLLEMGLRGPLSESQADTVSRARRSIQTALGLIAQLLDIERAQSGQLQITHESFDLGDLARETIAEFAAAADLKALSLQLALPADDSLATYSDRARVRQIIANLISNGVKYTPRGGRVSVRVLVVSDDTARPGQWLAVVVDDNGLGIPLDKQHLLFREFTRFTPEVAEGSGVGLAISDKLARALGGAISFRSAAGTGSTFTLWLPKKRQTTLG